MNLKRQVNQEILNQNAQIAKLNGDNKTEKTQTTDENLVTNAQISARKAALKREKAENQQIIQKNKLTSQCSDLEKEIAFLKGLKTQKKGKGN